MLLHRDSLLARLSRAVTIDNGYLSDHLPSDLRMLREMGAKFLGRAAHIWVFPHDDQQRLQQAADFAQAVHEQVDHDIVLQCAIFEAIFPAVDSVPIPAWVFEALDEPVEERNFRFSAMYSDLRMAPSMAEVWLDDGEVPDLTLAEARRWYIYRAGCYFDAGYEALHLGQIHLVAARDQGFHYTADLIRRIRQLATQRARRGAVIIDAHSHGIVRHGHLLLDFVSRPLSGLARLLNGDDEDLVLQWKGGLAAGWHAGGWYAEQVPNLVEIDNWGGRSLPLDAWDNRPARQAQGRWGWDDVSWFARRTAQQRADFLTYAHRHCRLGSPVNFLQFPVCRTLGNSPMLERGPTATHYRANPQDEDCPCGWGDAQHMRQIWQAVDPQTWQSTDTAEPDPVGIPLPVLILGEIQAEFGGVPNDTQCPYSRLRALGGSIAGHTFVIPRAGDYHFVVAAGGTRMEPLGMGMSPGGAPWHLRITEPAQPVTMRYDYCNRSFSAIDPRNGESLLVE